MRDHNYYRTFLGVAEDSRATTGVAPQPKAGADTVASLQYRLITEQPYGRTQEDVLFEVHAIRRGLSAGEFDAERPRFFSKGQPCLRTSPLGKQYGWGLHFREDGKVALYAIDSDEYARYSNDPALRQFRALRSSR